MRAIGIRKDVSPRDDLFSQKREIPARMSEFNEEWSGPEITAHPPPGLPEMSESPLLRRR